MSASHRLAPPIPETELARWRARLMSERQRIRSDLDLLHEDAQPTDRVALSSNHLAEGASDAQDQGISTSSAIEEGELLRLIDRALRKIDTGLPLPYGICEWTKEPIARERLELMPWTPLSAAAAEHQERQHLAVDDLLEPG